jgi:hypothetical protein
VSRWFRMYDDVLDDPKVQRLPADLFKVWVNLLCIASKNGGYITYVTRDTSVTGRDDDDLAFALRMNALDVDQALSSLIDRGLVERDDRGLRPHNWNARQFKSDADPTAADRQKRKRERDKSEDVTRDKPVTSHPPEQSRTDTDTEKINTPRKARVQSCEVDGFDAFWDEYPRKTAKGAARQAFIKAQAKVENGHLLEAARRYAASKPDPKFTPHPATWLNQERWLDVDCSAKAITEPFKGTSNGQVFVKQGTDAFDAWSRWWRKTKGVSAPTNQDGGWFFPSEYPQEQAA